MKPKIIIFDIETLGLTANDPILCISWKEFGKKEMHFRSAWDYPAWEKLSKARNLKEIEQAFQELDAGFLKDIFDAFCEADCVVGHFQDYFDYPFIQTRLWKHKIGTLPKTIQTDTWKIVKKFCKLRSNRLQAINEFFGITNKIKQKDLSLWHTVLTNNTFAKKEMQRYNEQDIRATEALLKVILKKANLPLVPEKGKVIKTSEWKTRICFVPGCGGHMTIHAIKLSQSGSYRQVRCKKCLVFGKLSKTGITSPAR